MANIKSSIGSKKKGLAVAIVLLLIVALAVLAYRQSSLNKSVGNGPLQDPEEIINLSGPTEQEKKSAEEAKARIIEEEQRRNTPPVTAENGKRSVSPTITYAGQYGDRVEVGGFVTGVFEDGGICKLTLQKGNITQTVEVTGVKGASSVDCPVMSISRSTLEPGTWQAVLSYSSSTSEGQSAARTLEVN